MSDYYSRVVKIADLLGFSLNSFAKKGLGYSSYEKLRRLKDSPDNKPSIDILEDINRNFPQVNMTWLISGKGNVLIDDQQNVVYLNNLPEDKMQLSNFISEANKRSDDFLNDDAFAAYVLASYKKIKNDKRRDDLRGKILDD